MPNVPVYVIYALYRYHKMSVVDICMNSICEQRRKQMLYTVSPMRYTPLSPYVQFPQYTQKQFDMRRKAEILQYSAAKSNTKTNNFTKSQKWSQLIRGISQSRSYTTVYQRNQTTDICDNIIDVPYTYDDTSGNTYRRTFDELYTKINATADCSMNDLIPTPTSSSGIPGPIEYLVRDVKVPLYNYASNTDNYSILQSENTDMWSVYTTNDLSFLSNSQMKLMTLVIREKVDQYSYTCSLNVPISIYVEGNTTTSTPLSFSDLSLNINSVSLRVVYNNSDVTLQKSPVFQINNIVLPSVNNTATAAPTSAYLNYDVSMNSYAYSYSIQKYVGVLSISNIYLFTEPGYIYDFYLTFNMRESYMNKLSYVSSFNTTKSGIICNSSYANQLISRNVKNISSNNNIPELTNFTFGGL